MPIEIASPVSRLRSNIAERAPLWVASAGIADSLYSLIALSRSLFLNLDLMTPACMFHLREKRSNSRCAVRSARWSSHGTRTVRHTYPSLEECRLQPDSAPGLGRRVKARILGRQQILAYYAICSCITASGVPTATAVAVGASSFIIPVRALFG